MDDTQISPDAITAREGAAPAPAPAPEESAPAPADATSEVNPELVRIPAVQAIFAGQPPAFSFDFKDAGKNEQLKLLEKHRADLKEAGMVLYKSISGKTGVVANMLYLHPEDLKQADKEGTLTELAPPFEQLNHTIGKSGENNPILSATPPAYAPTGPRARSVPQASNTLPPPPPAAAQRAAMKARLQNIQPSAPTSGPAPGAGALLRSILKPVL